MAGLTRLFIDQIGPGLEDILAAHRDGDLARLSRAAHHLGVRHGMEGIGEAKRAEFREQAHLDQILAGEPLGEGAVAIDLGALGLSRAPGDVFDA